jgi:uncharacterized protein YndB with AHSA1/START domain
MSEAIIIEKVFEASRALVWKAWTDPELVKQWWGPEGFSAPSVKIDLRVGGKYVYAMQGPAGSEWDKVMYSAGLYKEIVPEEKMVVTDYFSDEDGNPLPPTDFGQGEDFPSEMSVTVLFESLSENQTKLTIIYPKPESEAHFQAMLKSGMKEGWSSSLDKMARVLGK